MPSVSALGASSGQPLQKLVDDLMRVDPNQLQLNRLDREEQAVRTEISAYGQEEAALEALKSKAEALSTVQTLPLSRPATSTDPSMLTAGASADAIPGSYNIVISQLAQAQKLAATVGQLDQTTAINTGTLTLTFGAKGSGSFTPTPGEAPLTVEIDADHNSLQGIRDAINAAGTGKVSATIVNDGSSSPYHLVLTSLRSGEPYSMQIAVVEDGGLDLLTNLLAYDPTVTSGQGLSEAQPAQNANFTIDGLAISKPSNTVNDAIGGVTLELKQVTAGSPVVLTVGDLDPALLVNAVKEYAKAYNNFQALNAKLTMSQASGNELASSRRLKEGLVGPLSSDLILRTLDRQLRTRLLQPVDGKTLLTMGVAFQKDGVLTVDSATLTKAIVADTAGVQQLLAHNGAALTTFLSSIVDSDGLISQKITRLNKSLGGMDKQRENFVMRLDMVRKRYVAQFAALDLKLNQAQQLGDRIKQLSQKLGQGK